MHSQVTLDPPNPPPPYVLSGPLPPSEPFENTHPADRGGTIRDSSPRKPLGGSLFNPPCHRGQQTPERTDS